MSWRIVCKCRGDTASPVIPRIYSLINLKMRKGKIVGVKNYDKEKQKLISKKKQRGSSRMTLMGEVRDHFVDLRVDGTITLNYILSTYDLSIPPRQMPQSGSDHTSSLVFIKHFILSYRVILSVRDPRKCEYLKDYSLDFEHAYMTTYLAS